MIQSFLNKFKLPPFLTKLFRLKESKPLPSSFDTFALSKKSKLNYQALQEMVLHEYALRLLLDMQSQYAELFEQKRAAEKVAPSLTLEHKKLLHEILAIQENLRILQDEITFQKEKDYTLRDQIKKDLDLHAVK